MSPSGALPETIIGQIMDVVASGTDLVFLVYF